MPGAPELARQIETEQQRLELVPGRPSGGRSKAFEATLAAQLGSLHGPFGQQVAWKASITRLPSDWPVQNSLLESRRAAKLAEESDELEALRSAHERAQRRRLAEHFQSELPERRARGRVRSTRRQNVARTGRSKSAGRRTSATNFARSNSLNWNQDRSRLPTTATASRSPEDVARRLERGTLGEVHAT